MALIPENRMEQILNGDSVTPQNRDEYFVKKAIDNAGQGGGGGLPPVTPANAYEVPRVTAEGKWVTERVDFGVVFDYDNGNVSTDTDVVDICAARNDHKNVFGILGRDGNSYSLPLLEVGIVEHHPVVKFAAVIDNANVVITGTDGGADAPDTWTYTETAQDSVFVVDLTDDGEGHYYAMHDGEPISIAEIYAAYQSGMTIIGVDSGDSDSIFALSDIGESFVAFSSVSSFDGIDAVTYLGTVEDSDEWHRLRITIPAPSEEENGKVLGVVRDGNYFEYALVDTVPPADAEYNGLVLGIKDGEYEFFPASRIEGGPVCVTISEDNGSYVTDITPNELIAALEAGSLIQVHYKLVTGQITQYVNYLYEALIVNEGTGYGLTISIYDSNETTLRKYLTFTSADGDTAFSRSSV